MQQSRLNAYLKLIQELLTCPRGEEWIRLKQHEDLVDAEFVQVMEQVASQLLQEGNEQAATFLHNWAAKLHHILVKEPQPPRPEEDKTEAYTALITALLDNPEELHEQILTKHRDLIGPGLVHTMNQVAQRLKQQGSDGLAHYLQNLAANLNQAWLKAHAFQPDLNKKHGPEPVKPTAAEVNDGTSAAEPAPETSPLSQPLTDAIHEMSQLLRQLNQTLTARATNPLWYMDVLERAANAQWLLTTDEIEQLIGVKPKCHGQDRTYQRGSWTFIKVGRLGAQTAWKVTKARLVSLDETDSDRPPRRQPDRQPDQQPDNGRAVEARESLAKHPPLQPDVLNSRVSEPRDAFEIPEMDDVWA